MKKLIKKSLIILSAFIGIIVIFMLGYMFIAKSEIKEFTPLETQKINEDVLSINDSFVNMYLVQSESGYIAFDAGNNLETIKNELETLTITPDKIIAVFLTHTDGDHTAALSIFKNAKVYLSDEEEKLLTGKANRFLIFGNTIDCDHYNLFEDREVININNISIKCIITPGHTLGSSCYLVNNKYLFTGDALSLKDGKIGAFNNFFNVDTKTQIKSLEKLSQLDSVEYIFTSHYGMSTNFEFAFSKVVQ